MLKSKESGATLAPLSFVYNIYPVLFGGGDRVLLAAGLVVRPAFGRQLAQHAAHSTQHTAPGPAKHHHAAKTGGVLQWHHPVFIRRAKKHLTVGRAMTSSLRPACGQLEAGAGAVDVQLWGVPGAGAAQRYGTGAATVAPHRPVSTPAAPRFHTAAHAADRACFWRRISRNGSALSALLCCMPGRAARRS